MFIAYMPTIYLPGAFFGLTAFLTGLCSLSITPRKKYQASLLFAAEILTLLLIAYLESFYFFMLIIFSPLVFYCFFRDIFERKEQRYFALMITAASGCFLLYPLHHIMDSRANNYVKKYHFYVRHILPTMEHPVSFLQEHGYPQPAAKQVCSNLMLSYWSNPSVCDQYFSPHSSNLPEVDFYWTHPRMLWRAYKQLDRDHAIEMYSLKYSPMGITMRHFPDDEPVKFLPVFKTLFPSGVVFGILVLAALVFLARTVQLFTKQRNLPMTMLHGAVSAMPVLLLGAGLGYHSLEEYLILDAVYFSLAILPVETFIQLYKLLEEQSWLKNHGWICKLYRLAVKEFMFIFWVIVCTTAMEFLFRGTFCDTMPGSDNFYYQCLMVYVIILPFRVLLGVKAASLVLLALTSMWGVANYMKNLLLGEPLLPDEFISVAHVWQSMLFVAKSWAFVFVCAATASTIAAVIYIVHKDQTLKYTWKRWTVGAAALIFTVIFLIWIPVPLVVPRWTSMMTNTSARFKQDGLLLSFIHAAHRRIPTPEKDAAEMLKAEMPLISKEAAKYPFDQNFKPHVIIILSESAANPEKFKNITFPDGSPFDLDKIGKKSLFSDRNQCFSGVLQVPTYGGHTVRCEFEVLSGISSNMLPNLPYSYLPKRKISTLAELFKQRGYRTTFIHPYTLNVYSRFAVMPNLGFETLLDRSAFPDEEGDFPYYSDNGFVEGIIDHLQKNQHEPQFMYCTSIQNHAPYYSPRFRHVPQYKFDTDPKFTGSLHTLLRRYLTGISLSGKSLEKLLAELDKKVQHPTVVIVFGDHRPMLDYGKEIYKNLDPDFANTASYGQFRTEYLIWSNYRLPYPEALGKELKAFELGRRGTFAAGALPYDQYIYLFDKLQDSQLVRENRYGTFQRLFQGEKIEPEVDKYFRMYHSRCYDDFMNQVK